MTSPFQPTTGPRLHKDFWLYAGVEGPVSKGMSWRTISVRIVASLAFAKVWIIAAGAEANPSAIFAFVTPWIDLGAAHVVPFLERDVHAVDVVVAVIAPP